MRGSQALVAFVGVRPAGEERHGRSGNVRRRVTMHRDRKAAFTLIELLVVIAVIAIIAAILFPVFAAVRGKGWQTVCLSNQKQIGAAVMMYMQDYDERFPFVLNWSGNFVTQANIGDNGKWPMVRGVTGTEPQFRLVTVVAPYVRNANVWYCPSVGPDYVWEYPIARGDWPKGATMRDQGTTYAYTYLTWPSSTLFYDPSRYKFMGGKSYAILLDASRWPMITELPGGIGFTGNITAPPASAQPHSGGVNVAYGDGHAKFHRMETADGNWGMGTHIGDGLYPGQ
jgi:prepilin-type N-terminal cleavage/methylation domain-containing protein/prepilin-type processing-associated H-X9-DG protein